MGIKAIGNLAIIRPDIKSWLTESGLVLPDTWNPYDVDYATQRGTIVSPPTFSGNGTQVEIEAGDYVYTHHFLMESENRLIHKEEDGVTKMGWHKDIHSKDQGYNHDHKIAYGSIIARVRDKEIKAINNFVLLSPIPYDKPESTLEVVDHQKYYYDRAIVAYPSDYAKASMGIEKGMLVLLKEVGANAEHRQYMIEIEGNYYFRVTAQECLAQILGDYKSIKKKR